MTVRARLGLLTVAAMASCVALEIGCSSSSSADPQTPTGVSPDGEGGTGTDGATAADGGGSDCTPPSIPGAEMLSTDLGQVSSLGVDDGLVYALGPRVSDFKRGVYSLPKAGGPLTAVAEADVASRPGRVIVSGARVYWADNAGIHSVDKAGGSATVLGPETLQPTWMAAEGAKLYWIVDSGAGGVVLRSAPLAGGAPTNVYTSPSNEDSFAVDGTNAYFGDRLSITVIALANGAKSTLYTAQSASEDVLGAPEVSGATLYFLGTKSIRKIATTGPSPVPTDVSPAHRPFFPTIGADLVWLEPDALDNGITRKARMIRAVALAGGAARDVVQDPWEITGYAGDATHLYWVASKNSICPSVVRRIPR